MTGRSSLLRGKHFFSVTETLVPVLQPGDIAVIDNLSAYKVAGVQDAIKAAEL
nr:hypothetical protein [Methylobacterium durans]